VTWNYLVNEYDYREDAKNVHFTDGGPYFEEYKNDDYAEELGVDLRLVIVFDAHDGVTPVEQCPKLGDIGTHQHVAIHEDAPAP
ncbi:hypothetical protein ACC677_37680, partial [Rhizobium ruizarguesonis]